MEEFRPDVVRTWIDKCLAFDTPDREYAFEQLSRRLSIVSDRLHLLDVHLAAFVSSAVAALTEHLSSSSSSSSSSSTTGLSPRLEHAARVLSALASVRGTDAVVRLLPQDMDRMQPVLATLARCTHENKDIKDNHVGVVVRWETLFVLLAWMGELVRTPIALTRVVHQPILLLQLGQQHLHAPGKPGDAAAMLLARLVARPDCLEMLAPLVAWCLNQLQGSDEDLAVYNVLAKLLTTCGRDALLPLAPDLLQRLTAGGGGGGGGGQEVMSLLRRKTLLKVVQRIGLVCLAPRLAPWRYQRGSRLLFDGLIRPKSEEEKASAAAAVAAAEAAAAVAAKETWFVPREVDRVMHLLLVGLKDRDTVVRWCAAKGIGRVSERLPADFAEEVVEAVLELCNPTEEENAWHGSCLAVAELARRGLLLPARLSHALPAVLEALRYDAKHGARSVGSQVRDAACYVMWACARAYAPPVLAPFSITIASGLLECATLDRELNCRRAASAAIQEHVGRVALMPHGLDLVGLTDYFKLGSLKTSYIEIAAAVCGMPEYGPWMVDTVLERKLVHWDVQVREVAATLFGIMSSLESCRAAVLSVLPRIRDMCVNATLPEVRHGAILALANSIEHLVKHGSLIVDVTTVIPELDAARLFRGKGGEHVRVAACVLAEKISSSAVPLVLDSARLRPHLAGRPDSNKTCAKRHKEFLDECLRNASEDVQQAASCALARFASSYLVQLEPKVRKAIVAAYCTILGASDQAGSYTRGAARALGALPPSLFDGESWIESQKALARTVQKCPDQESRTIALGSLQPCLDSTGAIISALGDYTTDERGDVGCWTREAACIHLPRLLQKEFWSDGLQVEEALCRLAEIYSGRMDRLRAPARAAIIALTKFFPHLEQIRLVFAVEDQSPDEVWNECCNCLLVTEPKSFVFGAFLGLSVSSGLRAPDARAREVLVRFVASRPELQSRLWSIVIPQLLRERGRDDRVISHLLSCLDSLLRNGCFLASDVNQVQSACWDAFSSSTSVPLLCVGIDVMCAMLRFHDKDGASLKQVALLLDHAYPRVRQHCCLQLHVAVSSFGLGKENVRSQIEALLIQGASQENNVNVAKQVWLLIK